MDVFLVEAGGKKSSVSLLEFLSIDMRHKIIYSIVISPLGKEYEYRSYKVRIFTIFSNMVFIARNYSNRR